MFIWGVRLTVKIEGWSPYEIYFGEHGIKSSNEKTRKTQHM